MQGGIYDFAKIVRSDISSHTDGNTQSSIQEKIWHGCGHNCRFGPSAIIVWPKINSVLVYITEKFGRKTRHFGFGITHGRGWIAVYVAKIALTIDQGISHGEILGHPYHRLVYSGISMRMIATEDISDDHGRFAEFGGKSQAFFVHGEENTTVYGLESITNIGKSPIGDHGHGVVKKRLAHLGASIPSHNTYMWWFIGDFWFQ